MQINGAGSAYFSFKNAYDLGGLKEGGSNLAPSAKAPASPAQVPDPAPNDELAAFKNDLRAFQDEQQTPGGSIANMMSIPVNDRGYSAVPTPDQQKLIDKIFARHQNDAELKDPKTIFEQTAVWRELTENGVNVDQIVSGAKFFYAPDGSIVDRRTATIGVDKMA